MTAANKRQNPVAMSPAIEIAKPRTQKFDRDVLIASDDLARFPFQHNLVRLLAIGVNACAPDLSNLHVW